jgi:hypothetical protein
MAFILRKKDHYRKKIEKETAEDIIYGFYYQDFNIVGNIKKMTTQQYVDKVHEFMKLIGKKYNAEIIDGQNQYDGQLDDYIDDD